MPHDFTVTETSVTISGLRVSPTVALAFADAIEQHRPALTEIAEGQSMRARGVAHAARLIEDAAAPAVQGVHPVEDGAVAVLHDPEELRALAAARGVEVTETIEGTTTVLSARLSPVLTVQATV